MSNGTQAGREMKIHCPQCASSGRGQVYLVVRTNRKTQTDFLGCPEWPECSYTAQMPEYVKMMASGQPTLFDLMGGT